MAIQLKEIKEIHWVDQRETRKRVICGTMEVPPGSARSNPGSKPSRLSLLARCLPSTSADESLSWRIVLYFTSRCSPLPLPLLPRRRDHKLLNIKPCFQSVRRGGGCQGLHFPPCPPPFFFFLHLRRHLDRRRSSTSLFTYPCLRYVHASRGSTYKAELRLSPFVVRLERLRIYKTAPC